MSLDALALRLGLSDPGQVLILVGATAATLPLPDIDLAMQRVLHHRSILTHSLLIPALAWWFLPVLGPAPAAGAFLGVAIHLAADSLSPARGFGRVWWPAPVRRSLGSWSRPWLLAHAVGGGWAAAAILPSGPLARALILAAGVGAALRYGLRNERSLVSAAVAVALVGGGMALHWRPWA